MPVIPLSLQRSDAFRGDLKRLSETPTPVIREILGVVRVRRYPELSDDDVEVIAERYSMDRVALRAAGLIAAFLRSALIGAGGKPEELLREIRTTLKDNGAFADEEAEILELFAFTEDERDKALANVAFSVGATFLSSEFKPCFLPDGAGSALIGGYLWSLSYLDSQGTAQSVTFGLTESERADLEKSISDAEGQLATIKSALNGKES